MLKNRYIIVLLTILMFTISECNTQFQKEDGFAVEIVDNRIHEIVNEVKKDIGGNLILTLTLRTSNHTPFNTGYDWFVAYVNPVSSNISSSSLKNNPPIAYSYLNGTLVLLYTDAEFAVAHSDKFMHSLREAIDKEIPPVEKKGIPPNINNVYYRFEYCDGELKKNLSNIFLPDIIPDCEKMQ